MSACIVRRSNYRRGHGLPSTSSEQGQASAPAVTRRCVDDGEPVGLIARSSASMEPIADALVALEGSTVATRTADVGDERALGTPWIRLVEEVGVPELWSTTRAHPGGHPRRAGLRRSPPCVTPSTCSARSRPSRVWRRRWPRPEAGPWYSPAACPGPWRPMSASARLGGTRAPPPCLPSSTDRRVCTCDRHRRRRGLTGRGLPPRRDRGRLPHPARAARRRLGPRGDLLRARDPAGTGNRVSRPEPLV